MKTSGEQYARGFVSWEPPTDAYEFTIESQTEGGLIVPSAPLTDSSGSAVSVMVDGLARFAIRLKSAVGPPLTKFRWERAQRTSVWDGLPTGEALHITHLPDYGIYHRLVLSAGNCDWGEDSVVTIGSVRIRLVTGRVDGERAAPIDQVTIEDGKISLTGEPSGAASVEGRFVDVVASGDTPDAAEQNAWSSLGLAALILGPASVDQVVFSEQYEAKVGDFGGALDIPIITKIPYKTDLDAADLIDQALGALQQDTRTSRSLRLALRWLVKGLRTEIDEDAFFAFFIGIETLVNAFVAEAGRIPVEVERRRKLEAHQKQLERLLGDEFATALPRLVAPTLNEKFAFYGRTRQLPDENVDDFRGLNRARNDAFHGDFASIDTETVSKSEKLLVTMLKNALNVERSLAWEQAPRLSHLSIEYAYRPDPADNPTANV